MMFPGGRRGLRVLVLGAGILTCFPAGDGHATTLRRMGLGELIGRSDSISVSRCRETRTYFGGRNQRKIFTDYVFSVSDVVKGAPRDRLTLTLLGGRIQTFEMTVAGGPRFRVGDEVVLFTAGQDSGRRILVGYTQGVFPVITDPETGNRYVSPRDFTGVRFLGRRGEQGEHSLGGKILLEDFLGTIQALKQQPDGSGNWLRTRPGRLSDGEQADGSAMDRD